MYRVNKEIGTSENVYLQNTDTMAELNLGRITPRLLRILELDGYKFDGTDGAVTLKEKWTLKVSDGVKDELRKLAMPMKKPIRDQRKVKQEEKKETKQPVDVLDIIYGLAQ
jgi:hypothetical protein